MTGPSGYPASTACTGELPQVFLQPVLAAMYMQLFCLAIILSMGCLT